MKTINRVVFQGTRTRVLIVLFIAVAIAAGFLLIFANDMLARVLNDHLMVQNFDGFALAMLLTAGLFTLRFALTMFGDYLFEDFSRGTITRLPYYYISRLLSAKHSYFASRPVAKLHADLWTASQASGGFYGNLLRLVSRVAIFVFYGIVVFRFDVWAGVFSILALPVYFLLTLWTAKRIAALQSAYVEKNGELATVTQEAFDNVRNVKAKAAHGFFLGRPAQVLRSIKNITVKVGVISLYTVNITGLIRIVAPIFIIFGAIQVSANFDATAGNIMVLFINIPLFLLGLADFLNGYIYYKMSRPFLDKLDEFNAAELEFEGGTELESFQSLQTQGVSVTFEGGRIVHVPDFEVRAGEKVMFFGESGIGKSTVFNIIMGFQDYDGTLLVNGINLREISFASIRRIFGITFQHTNAITLDLRDNILLGTQKSDDELMRLIKLTQLEAQKDTKDDAILNNNVLSGGEKSRLGLAQMLACDPEIMLIDEAFSNMDEELESKIISDLFAQYPDRAVICVSHRISSKPFFGRVIEFTCRLKAAEGGD